MSLLLKKITSVKPHDLLIIPKFWARQKKIDPKLPPPGKYDVNPPRSFKYSYEEIPDNLEKSGRLVYKNPLTSHVKKLILRHEYRDFKEQERIKNMPPNRVQMEMSNEEAKHIIEYMQEYVEEHKPDDIEKVEFNLEEVLQAKLKKKKDAKVNPYDEIYEKLNPDPVSKEKKAEINDGREEKLIEIIDETENFEDPIWGKEQPIERKYDKIIKKELFWISRNEKHYSDSDRRISYLKEFVRPFVIHNAEISSTINKIREKTDEKFLIETNPDFQIENFYQGNQEIKELFSELKSQITKINYKYLPSIALSLAFDLRYKVDKFKIWDYIEKEIFHNLHHFDLLEIAKIHYAMAGFMPKVGSLPLHKACLDLIKQEIKHSNIYDVLYIYTSYKSIKRNKLHYLLFQELINRKNEVVLLAKRDPDLIANLIYTYANSRILNYCRRQFREKDEHIQEAEQLVDLYYDELMKGFNEISLEATCRLSLGFSIMRIENYIDIALKIENKILKNLENLDAFLVSNFLYSFSKFSNGRSEGSVTLYNRLMNYVEKFWNEFTNKDKSRIFYAFTSRGFKQDNCELFEKYFIPWAQENVLVLSHSEMANTIMSLMYLRYVGKDFWANMIKNISKHKLVIPLVHYFPFQIAKYYLKIFYPNWDYKTYDQALFESSCEFNTSRIAKPVNNEEFLDFLRVLQFKYHLNIRPFLEWENLFIVDVAILPQKIAVLKQGVAENFQDSYDIRPFYKLKKFILENNGWQVWILNWKEYLEQGEKKDDWFMQNFKQVYDDQTIRFAKKEFDKRKEPNWIWQQYEDLYDYWVNKTEKGLKLIQVDPETGDISLNTHREKEEKLDSRVFATFGKQGPAKAAGGGGAAAGGGGAPAGAKAGSGPK